jgi:hypothetical protein
MSHAAVFRPLQAKFLTIPQSPICYWLRDRFFELLAGPTLSSIADVCQGLATADDSRFVRYTAEAPTSTWSEQLESRRWVSFEKGGGYGKWYGHHYWLVEWQHVGARLKAITAERYGSASKRIFNEDKFFNGGFTFSVTARGSLGVRVLECAAFSSQSAGIIPRESLPICAVINARLSSALIRGMTAQMYLRESYVSRLPVPEQVPSVLAFLESACECLKRRLVALDPLERSFQPRPVDGPSLAAAYESASEEAEAVAAVLHGLEGISERQVFAGYAVAGDDLAAVLDETGTPAGWHPLLAGYDQIPPLPERIKVPVVLDAPLAAEPRRAPSGAELAFLKARLKGLYEAGLGGQAESEESDPEVEDDEEAESAVSGARVAIPAETFIEDLALKVEVHPISVFWLLKQLRREGVISHPERRRWTEDHFSILLLQLLGHRWPQEIEGQRGTPDWQDNDGIIPLVDGTGEAPLILRVRERLGDSFGEARVNAIEAEFTTITGKSLNEWFATEFFRRHISQFRKRPVVWQIQSGVENRKGLRGGRRRAPAFSCLIYYHRLDADLLPKLRSQYVGPLRSRLETELGGLERIADRTDEQNQRRETLLDVIDELKDFDKRLEAVIMRGFESDLLNEFSGKEPLDRWTASGENAAPPATREVFVQQERAYNPDRNDGVRVNIAPLQKAGLLASPVLAAKDVDKAIADRATWRADERRWCRQGKLPRPGWWLQI